MLQFNLDYPQKLKCSRGWLSSSELLIFFILNDNSTKNNNNNNNSPFMIFRYWEILKKMEKKNGDCLIFLEIFIHVRDPQRFLDYIIRIFFHFWFIQFRLILLFFPLWVILFYYVIIIVKLFILARENFGKKSTGILKDWNSVCFFSKI